MTSPLRLPRPEEIDALMREHIETTDEPELPEGWPVDEYGLPIIDEDEDDEEVGTLDEGIFNKLLHPKGRGGLWIETPDNPVPPKKSPAVVDPDEARRAEARAELDASRVARAASKAERDAHKAVEAEAARKVRAKKGRAFEERYPKDEEGRRIYHRIESDTQSAETAQKQVDSGEIHGRAAHNTLASDQAKVKAYMGPLPEGARGVEFATDVEPDKGCARGWGLWSLRDGEEAIFGEDGWTKLKVTIRKNTQAA